MQTLKIMRTCKNFIKVLFICSFIGALFCPTAVQASEDSQDISGIQFPSWMRIGRSADRGIMSQDQDGRKTVSILSDSLGTYEGYSAWPAYYYYYCDQYMDVSDTWWMHYIEQNNMRLGVNESLGGSKVAWWEGDPSGYNSMQCMAANERIERLDDNGTPRRHSVFWRDKRCRQHGIGRIPSR